MLSGETRKLQGKAAVAVRHYGKNSQAAIDADRAFRAAALEEHVRKIVEAAPPLTQEQRSRIAALLGTEPPPELTDSDVERMAAERKRLDALAAAKRLAKAILECDVCNNPEEAHRGLLHHDWQPGRADRLLKGVAL